MKNTFVFNSFLALSASILLLSCNGRKDYGSSSRATGWKYNSSEGGFQVNTNYKEQETGPGLVFIEGGTFTMGRVQDDVMHDWNNTPTQQHVQSFYMDETEVTNIMYLEYLDWLKSVYPPTEPKYKNIYHGALPDTLVWRNRLGFNEMMTNNYLRHPAYAQYPVVGVNWIQAVEFSNWRTNRVNEGILADANIIKPSAPYEDVSPESTFDTETYLNAPSQTYGGNDEAIRGGRTSERLSQRNDSTGLYVQRKDGLLLPKYRLPTETEWEYAALGLVEVRSYNIYRGRKKYPWTGKYTRSGKRRTRGDQLANFKQGDGDYGGIAGWSDDGADITAPVASYNPNDYGLYDMAGNVAEWVADVYRPIVDDEYNDFNYYRGNVYTKNALNPDGTVRIATTDSIIYDTISNGKIVARVLPGGILQVPIDENETYLRTNFNSSDNRNFRDGDKSSSRNFFGYETFEGNPSKRMYNAPIHSVTVSAEDSTKLDRKYDESSNRTTIVDDNVRVFKGGSWKDRAYWLDPAQRRFFPQDMSTDYIGFRNAMSRVGEKAKQKKTPKHRKP